MVEIKLTKEEQIIQSFKESGLTITNKSLMDKFNIKSEQYLISLRFRIKNEYIKL